eukprot:1480108-Rhodomonas_salina.2
MPVFERANLRRRVSESLGLASPKQTALCDSYTLVGVRVDGCVLEGTGRPAPLFRFEWRAVVIAWRGVCRRCVVRGVRRRCAPRHIIAQARARRTDRGGVRCALAARCAGRKQARQVYQGLLKETSGGSPSMRGLGPQRFPARCR